MTNLARGRRVALIGDSHMEALGPRLRDALPRRLGVQVVGVTARRGWSVPRYLSAGDVPHLVRDAEIVIVELGGNDASLGRSAEQHAAEVGQLIDRLGGRDVIWVGPGVTLRSDLEARRAPIRHAQKRVVEGRGGTWIDSRELTRSSDLASDGVHFTRGGYDRWSALLVPKLAAAGRSGVPRWVGPLTAGLGALFAVGAYQWSRRR